MAMELCHVFSRIAAWRADDSHAFIQSTVLISKIAEMQHALDRVVRSAPSPEETLGVAGPRPGTVTAMAPSPGGLEIAAMVSPASTLEQMPSRFPGRQAISPRPIENLLRHLL
jgi:hypothetical protein